MVGPMSSPASTVSRGVLLRFSENRIGYFAVLAALGIGVLTIFQLSQFDPVKTDGNLLTSLIVIDVVAVLILSLIHI